MPTLETRSGLRIFFHQLPSKSEVLESTSLQELVKACGGKLPDQQENQEQITPGHGESQKT